MAATPADVTGFWAKAGPDKWWTKSVAFDDAIRLRFEPVHHAAARSEHADWEATAEGALALILLFDQFPRNLYRSSAHAFATDPLARRIARDALDTGKDRATTAELRSFFYMPFMHAEDLADQDLAVSLFETYDADTGELSNLRYAVEHREIIRRFGRFPHRNPMLGRAMTAEERVFLDGGGFAG
jgi:uncharacterized protein (DUF924 family)